MSKKMKEDEFELLTTMRYEGGDDDLFKSIPLLNSHLNRLQHSHQALAKLLPQSWCAIESSIDPDLILNSLQSKLREDPQKKHSLRIKLTISKHHQISIITTPFSSHPSSSGSISSSHPYPSLQSKNKTY